MNAIKPAMPLPWNSGNMPASWSEQNAMYAVHAANAYPKLVDVLRGAREGFRRQGELSGGTLPRTVNVQYERVIDLLRELGETP